MPNLFEAIASDSDYNRIIAEIKIRSPRDGDLLGNRDPLSIAHSFETAGATALSFITGPVEYGGNTQLLKKICLETSIPVLRKDIVSSGGDIKATVDFGAEAVLLIASLLEKDLLRNLVSLAHDMNIDTVVEVHSASDIEKAICTECQLIGINNRDINRFEMDSGTVGVTEELRSLIPSNLKVISMSGIETSLDLERVLSISDAVLIGTTLMKSGDPGAKLREFLEYPVRR